jgi:hypothetical protein
MNQEKKYLQSLIILNRMQIHPFDHSKTVSWANGTSTELFVYPLQTGIFKPEILSFESARQQWKRRRQPSQTFLA